jgi:hypothetical protein
LAPPLLVLPVVGAAAVANFVVDFDFVVAVAEGGAALG